MSQYPGTYGLDPYNPSNDASYSTRRPISPPRTPSPSPSELIELEKPPVDFKNIFNPRTYFHKKYIPWIIGLAVLGTLVALLALYHTQIVHWLTPISNKLKDLPGGWAIPIAILFVISFPPLFGHEIVAVLCGVVWGLWVGFGIVAAGTFIGEVGNFYAFRYVCAARGQKLERDNLSYACLARIVRDGGFMIAVIARFSAIPGHFTTAVFSTCGMGIIVFSIAAIISLPKQLITVYLGVIIVQSDSGTETSQSRIISDVVLVVSFIVTVVAAWWILRLMTQAKPQVLHDRRKARAQKDWELGLGPATRAPVGVNPYASSTRLTTEGGAFNPSMEDVETYGASAAPVSVQPQRWDSHGRAITLLNAGPTREESGDAAGWDMGRHDGGSTAYSPKPAYASMSARSPGTMQQQQAQASPYIPTIPPPQPHQPAIYPPTAAPSNVRPAFYSPPSSPPPAGQNVATQSPYSQTSLPIQQQHSFTASPIQSPYQSPAALPASSPPSQPHAPPSVPRYQLHDGPAPSIISAAPTYQTFAGSDAGPPIPPSNSGGYPL